MSKARSFLKRHRLALQLASFCLIAIPPVGLYFAVTADLNWAVWVLMGLIVGGMLLAMLVSVSVYTRSIGSHDDGEGG